MNSLRIGCDRIIRWSITSGGEPYDLSGKNIRLKVSTRSTQFYVSTDDFSIDGNKIIWLFRGKDQKHLGPYTLTYIENEGMDDMLTFDRCNAFNFVACSCQESRSSSEDMEISNIDLSSEIKALGVKLWPNLIPLTYQELFFLRASSGLLPGAFYRITDYVTTTSQENTQSAGHQFDVIVLALTNDTLAERAWACHHEGDTYFQNSHLEAWQIWYCLDNDSDRFEWSVPASDGGKGVIYRMIDEFNNDCPYDFKNIQFRHPHDPVNYPDYYYTFSTSISGVSGDHSLKGAYCYGNEIGLYMSDKRQQLNRIVFINASPSSICNSNSFGNFCKSNSFGDNCYSNSFGNFCKSNSFGDYCYHNSFGSYCNSNSFGNECHSNSFGNSCDSNSFGDYCNNNSFGNNCRSNNFDGTCHHNSFGNSCQHNGFGNNCRSNSFGNSCQSSGFGNYCRYNKVDDGVSVTLNNNQTASSNQQVQNYHLTQGLTSKIIEVERNRAYETTVAVDSAGNVKQFCIADIIL